MKKKTIKAWIEIHNTDKKLIPSFWFQKPSKVDIKLAREYEYKIYPCEITYTSPTK